MTRRLDHRGVGLTELLGSIVLYGIILSLVATLLTLFFASMKRIATIERANSEGTLVVQTIESQMQSFAPTDYRTCVGESDCVILENHYSYELNTQTTEIELIVHDPILESTLSIVGGELLLNGIAYVFNDFSLDATSSLIITDNLGEITVTIHLILIAPNGESFSFTATYFFTQSNVPA